MKINFSFLFLFWGLVAFFTSGAIPQDNRLNILWDIYDPHNLKAEKAAKKLAEKGDQRALPHILYRISDKNTSTKLKKVFIDILPSFPTELWIGQLKAIYPSLSSVELKKAAFDIIYAFSHPADETDNHSWVNIYDTGKIIIHWKVYIRASRAMEMRDRIDEDGDMDYSKKECERAAKDFANAALPLLDLYLDRVPLKMKLKSAKVYGDGKDGLYNLDNEVVVEAYFEAEFKPKPGKHTLIYRDRNYPARRLPGRMHKGERKGIHVIKDNLDPFPPFVCERIIFEIKKKGAKSKPTSKPSETSKKQRAFQ